MAELARSFTFSRNALKQNITVSSVPAGIVILIGLFLFVAVSAHGDDQDTTPHLQAYIDATTVVGGSRIDHYVVRI